MRTPGRSPQSTPGGGAGENEPRHALFGSELDLLDRVRHKSRNDRKVALAMGDGKTTEEGQRRVAQATAALNGDLRSIRTPPVGIFPDFWRSHAWAVVEI